MVCINKYSKAIRLLLGFSILFSVLLTFQVNAQGNDSIGIKTLQIAIDEVFHINLNRILELTKEKIILVNTDIFLRNYYNKEDTIINGFTLKYYNSFDIPYFVNKYDSIAVIQPYSFFCYGDSLSLSYHLVIKYSDDSYYPISNEYRVWFKFSKKKSKWIIIEDPQNNELKESFEYLKKFLEDSGY
jgi:hypothetical protein